MPWCKQFSKKVATFALGMKKQLLIFITTASSALAGFAGETTQIDSLLNVFASRPSVTVANDILDRLDAEGITDQHYHFGSGATADTLRQQVFY